MVEQPEHEAPERRPVGDRQLEVDRLVANWLADRASPSQRAHPRRLAGIHPEVDHYLFVLPEPPRRRRAQHRPLRSLEGPGHVFEHNGTAHPVGAEKPLALPAVVVAGEVPLALAIGETVGVDAPGHPAVVEADDPPLGYSREERTDPLVGGDVGNRWQQRSLSRTLGRSGAGELAERRRGRPLRAAVELHRGYRQAERHQFFGVKTWVGQLVEVAGDPVAGCGLGRQVGAQAPSATTGIPIWRSRSLSRSKLR